MSLQQPSVADIDASIIADLEAAFSQTIPLLPRSFQRVLAKVIAGTFITLYKYGGFTFLQMLPQYASTEETTINGKIIIPLVQYGRLVGAGDPSGATRAEFDITVTVTEQTGALPINSQLLGATNGVTYITLAAVPLDAATVTATIRAVSDQTGGGGRGTIGNLNVGDVVSFANPLPNVATDAVVAAEVVTGADAEDWEVYRGRVVDRFRAQPQGGAYVDYRDWAELVEGIVNAYPYTGDPGTVEVYSEATPESSGDPDGIPTAPQLAAVLASIEVNEAGLATRRPVSSFVYSLPITRTAFEVTIVDLQAPDLPTLKTKVEEALTQYFLSREPYVAGLSLGKRRDRITNAAVAGAVQDVASAYSGVFQSVSMRAVGNPVVLMYSLDKGEKAKLDSVIYS